jgi:RNA polymerase sigma-70 factor (ECF subfamily)
MAEEDQLIITLLRSSEKKERGAILLLAKYQQRIYWYIRRLVVSHEDAEDIMQETFFNAYRYFDKFESNSGLYTWLYKIATNECLKFFAKQKTEFVDEFHLMDKVSEESIKDSKEIVVLMQKAIQMLPEKQKVVFNLRYYDDLDYLQISEITGDSVNNLKANYYHAVQRIKDFMVLQ